MPTVKTFSQTTIDTRRRTQQNVADYPKLTAQNKIDAYKKYLRQKKIVRVVKRRYRVLYFIQFWGIFIFLVMVNIYACLLVVLEDLYREKEDLWDVLETILMAYFILEFIIVYIMFKPPRYRIWF